MSHLYDENYHQNVKLKGIQTKKPISTTSNMTVGGNLAVTGTLSAGSETTTSQVITAASANAFTVGANGTTNPTLNVDTSVSSVDTGINIAGAAAGNGVVVNALSSGTNENLTIRAKGNGLVVIASGSGNTGAQIGSSSSLATAVLTVKSSNAQAFAVGLNGLTNPALNIDASTASSATGLNVKSAAAASGLAVSVISSGTNENLTVNAKGSGTLLVGSVSTGQVSIGRGAVKPPITSTTITALGTAQNTTPTAAQLVGGVITQTSATGAGTATLDNGTNISTAVPGVAVGDTFLCVYANLGGGQTVTITGATGSTVVGNGAVPSAKNAIMTFVNTGTNTWNVYVNVSA